MEPQDEEIFFLGQINRGELQMHPTRQRVHPKAEQKSNFLGNWGDVDGGRGYLGSFSVLFWGRKLKKGRQLFGEEKCTPDKILATIMVQR